MTLFWRCLTFDEISGKLLYEILRLRQEVFVVEQNCPYLDLDRKDFLAHHFIGFNDAREVMAYARILPVGRAYPDAASIGRVVTGPEIRGKGYGRKLMEQAIRQTEILAPNARIRISAQSHLTGFYGSLGFVSTGREYLEDGIPHTEMERLSRT
jgi:ElaA protein